MYTVFICLITLAAAPENLVANPGFEAVRGVVPIRWDLFVMPREGSYGEATQDQVYEGNYAAKLHNETAYDREPANNWSQSITTDMRNRELSVSGWAKTAGAAEAAIWIQCFQRRPLRILAFESTGTRTPVFGDTDWREVHMRVNVPNETDFIMVRCVILGEGTAWFDEISVVETLRRDAVPDAPRPEPRNAETPRPREQRTPPGDAADNAVEELRAMRQTLADANQTLRELNTALLAQISALQTEVERLREELRAVRPAVPQETPRTSAVPWPELPVPPLVPHVPRTQEDLP